MPPPLESEIGRSSQYRQSAAKFMPCTQSSRLPSCKRVRSDCAAAVRPSDGSQGPGRSTDSDGGTGMAAPTPSISLSHTAHRLKRGSVRPQQQQQYPSIRPSDGATDRGRTDGRRTDRRAADGPTDWYCCCCCRGGGGCGFGVFSPSPAMTALLLSRTDPSLLSSSYQIKPDDRSRI